jgi:peptidoglycan/xylan/chitin deacetylase (PgdA/CDA1 family)
MTSTRFPVLTFHSIDEQIAAISFPPDLFAYGISTLRRVGYQSVNLDVLADTLNRRLPFLDSTLAITFDDGYASVYQNAFPVLVENKMMATIFLTVGKEQSDRLPLLNGRTMLSWDEIREMHNYGIEFGAHTLTHLDLSHLSPSEIETEIRESKDRIEQMLGASVTAFAYPFGRFDARSHAIAQKYFACAVSDRLGWVRRASDLFALERLDAYYLQNKNFFGALSTLWFRGYIFGRSIPRNLRRTWITR